MNEKDKGIENENISNSSEETLNPDTLKEDIKTITDDDNENSMDGHTTIYLVDGREIFVNDDSKIIVTDNGDIFILDDDDDVIFLDKDDVISYPGQASVEDINIVYGPPIGPEIDPDDEDDLIIDNTDEFYPIEDVYGGPLTEDEIIQEEIMKEYYYDLDFVAGSSDDAPIAAPDTESADVNDEPDIYDGCDNTHCQPEA